MAETQIADKGNPFKVIQIDRSYNGLRQENFSVDGDPDVTNPVQVKGKTVLAGNPFLTFSAAGNNGAGNITATGVLVGDLVAFVHNLTTPGVLTSSFESVITTKDIIKQTAATNLSASTLMYVVIKKAQ